MCNGPCNGNDSKSYATSILYKMRQENDSSDWHENKSVQPAGPDRRISAVIRTI
jgi:hypothetical protein